VWLDVWLYFDGVEAVAFSVNTLLALLSALPSQRMPRYVRLRTPIKRHTAITITALCAYDCYLLVKL